MNGCYNSDWYQNDCPKHFEHVMLSSFIRQILLWLAVRHQFTSASRIYVCCTFQGFTEHIMSQFVVHCVLYKNYHLLFSVEFTEGYLCGGTDNFSELIPVYLIKNSAWLTHVTFMSI